MKLSGRLRRFFCALAVLGFVWIAFARVPQGPSSGSPQARAKSERTPRARREAIRLNNLGVAYMNQQRFEQALKLFEEAHGLDPKFITARLNQGIALFNLRRDEPARQILREVTEREPQNIRAWYSLGLLYKTKGQTEPALEAFGRAGQLDAHDADTNYFRGLLYAELGQYDPALAAFERALALNPFHISAEFGLARAYQRKGDSEQARRHLERFQKLTQEKLGAPMSLAYGDQGKYSLAEQLVLPSVMVPPAIPVRFVPVPGEESGLRFTHSVAGYAVVKTDDPLRKLHSNLHSFGPGACFFDYDGDGRVDLFIPNGEADLRGVLYRNAGGGRFVETTGKARLNVRGRGLGCTAGDYDNDGWTDLALVAGDVVRLFRNQGDGTFRDVTEPAGIHTEPVVMGLTFVDYDHDGDLDLYVTRVFQFLPGAPPPRVAPANNVLWRNNGNGTFSDLTQATGLAGPGSSLGAVATDFNNDRGMDLVVTGDGKGAPGIYINPREGRFQPIEPWAAPMPAPALGLAAFDFDKDGWMDLACTHGGGPGLTLWRNSEAKRVEPVPLPQLDWQRGWGLSALDFDNDGWLDLAAVGETSAGQGRIVLLRNRGPEGFENVSATVGLTALKLKSPRALITADYDGDGDTDLLATQNGGPVVLLRNEGGNKNNWLRISLKGLADNKSAIGTKVEVFAGALWQKWEVQSSSGYLGQNATEIIAGLGSAKGVDIVRLLWPTGVVQDEVQLAARGHHSFTEIDRRGSSCPILFVWNGTKFEFISDLIGAGIVGEWTGPGERNISDPDEYVRVEGHRVKERSGRLSFRLIEPMEEITYLDQVRLLAVDHPADRDVYPNERFQPAPPFPEFKVTTVKNPRPPRAAWDDEGRDVLALLAERDRRYVTGFRKLPFRGFTQPHSLTLDLGDLQEARSLRLIFFGFIEYFSATSMFAAYQAGIGGVAPYLEVQGEKGEWRKGMESIGFPAGLYRAMVVEVPLDRLGGLAYSSKVRITTNLEIYWDQILVDTSPQDVPVRVVSLTPSAADLHFRGYPRAHEPSFPGDLVYDYAQISATGPYRRHGGNYTRYGDVRELLADRDDRFAILGSGDEVSLEFDPSRLPPLPDGWKRDFFFYADGFEKDMDFHSAHAQTVEPLPFHAMGSYPYSAPEKYPDGPAHLAYQLEYNTRRAASPGSYLFRFEYARH